MAFEQNTPTFNNRYNQNMAMNYGYQTPQAPPSINLIWVQGIEGAKAYPVMPNQEVMLMDSENAVLYTKKADQQGRIIGFEIYDLVKREESSAPQIDLSQYVKISDVQQMVNELIDQRFDAFTSNSKK